MFHVSDIWREMSMQNENWLIANKPMGNKKWWRDIFRPPSALSDRSLTVYLPNLLGLYT
jgi:hypothetical protein